MLPRALTLPLSVMLLTVSMVSTHAEGFQPPRPDHNNFVVNEVSVNQIARVLGFVTAQSKVLDGIAQQHPQLVQQTEAHRRAFDATFSFPGHRALWFLENAIGASLANQHAAEMTRQADDAVSDLSLADAQSFLAEVDARLAGQIDVSVLTGMLWLRYAAQPDLELRDWWQGFSTEGHPKAAGLDLTLRLPLSWRQLDGDRPHVVAKWTSQYGSGDSVITLLVREIPETLNFEDMLEVERLGDWDWLVPEGFSFLHGRAIELDRQPGLQVDAMGERRVLDLVIANRTRTYVIFPPGRMVQLACMLGHNPNVENTTISRRYEALQDLCRQVALTVAFPSTYR